jgi:hypothetical protein
MLAYINFKQKEMKKITFLLTALIAFSCVVYCLAANSNANRKLKKPVFIASNEDSKLYDIKATDNYDSIFSYQMEMVQNDMGGVKVELHDVGTNGKELVDSTSYAGVFVEKFVFHRKGYEDTDTLYAWRVQLLYGMENEIMLNNVGTTLKIFGKNYGKSVSVSTSDGIIASEKAITNGVTEISIPTEAEYLNVDIKYDEQKHFLFKYPVRWQR